MCEKCLSPWRSLIGFIKNWNVLDEHKDAMNYIRKRWNIKIEEMSVQRKKKNWLSKRAILKNLKNYFRCPKKGEEKFQCPNYMGVEKQKLGVNRIFQNSYVQLLVYACGSSDSKSKPIVYQTITFYILLKLSMLLASINAVRILKLEDMVYIPDAEMQK